MCVSTLLVAAAPATAQDPPLYEFGEIVVTGKQPRVADEVASPGRTVFLGLELRPAG